MQRAFVYEDANGVRRTLIADDERPDRFVVKTTQDIEPLLASIARDRELMRNTGDAKILGRLPVEVYERAVHEQWDEGDWRKFWNGAGPDDLPNGRALRIWKPGANV
jgi:hypothetical protein